MKASSPLILGRRPFVWVGAVVLMDTCSCAA